MPRRTSKLQDAFEAPARALEEGVEFGEKVKHTVLIKRPFKLAEEYWETLGPGLTTGAADDDPSGIATYSQAGARYGLGLVWLSVFTFPLVAVVQEMYARIGLVSGRGLAGNIREHYASFVLYSVAILLFGANVFNIAADLSAMAAAMRLVVPGVDALLLVFCFAGISLALQIFTTYARYARYLKYMTLALLAYVAVAFSLDLDWGVVLANTFIPTLVFTREQWLLLCAILGTTISPYLFFWQTSQEIEEDVLRGERSIVARRHEANPASMRRMRTDVWSGMLFSNLIMFFIFVACAGTLFAHGVTTIDTADQAAEALRPFGTFAYLLFALGIVGTGFLAVPVLAGSVAYTFSETFGWRFGLYRTLKQAYAFYGVIIVAMMVAVLINVIGLDPIRSLIYAAIANGIVAPIVLYFVVKISDNTRIMGAYVNRPIVSAIGWFTVLAMALSGLLAVVSLVYW